jgi:hypothetical protein
MCVCVLQGENFPLAFPSLLLAVAEKEKKGKATRKICQLITSRHQTKLIDFHQAKRIVLAGP